ncbi:SpoIIE family protein phosphatase [Aureimonas pseudogalii]|uniref:Sigma-B regulation protein RsbU (Phosphoserine phosphatase) n=1 Tax=Aureimonas pseudogalii TaxID=1744844 RepID=A0A7W6H886_9HYPH|nr:SpoIIE family protein phosphatase [Aureimonas pseudogalii]MBB4000444.1 sigma-B regulation protein RsbU (phosphoserine phosphatase) [Aureimonas pseudogalii]
MNSLRVKIFVGVIAILALMAGGIMAYSLRAVRTAMVEAEQRSVENVLQMAELAIRSQYHQLLSGKVGAIQGRKEAFRQFGQTVRSTLDTLATQARSVGTSDEAARANALDWLGALSPVSGEYIFVFDREGRALVYPDRDMVGQDLSGFRDIRGRGVTQTAWSDSELYGSSFLTYSWRSLKGPTTEQKYGLFVPFPRWGWMIGIVGDVADLQRETDVQRAELVDRLRSSLGVLKLAGHGFVFVFDESGQSVVAPQSRDGDWLTPSVLTDLKGMASVGDEPSRLAPLAAAGPDRKVEAQVFRLKALGWYVAAVVSSAALAKPAQDLIVNQGLVFAGGIVLAAILAWFLAQKVSRPLVALTHRARALSETDFTRRSQFVSPDRPATSRDEVGRLAAAFSFMEDSLYRNVQTVMQVTQERERIEGELNIARDIQLGLLPKIFPAFPHRSEIDIHAALVSAKEVGGDLYDFYFIDERHLCFTIGDVAGKGVPAALFMAITKTLIKSAADRFSDPWQMMTVVNEALSSDNPNSIFVTSLIGVLDCVTGEIRYANGGHNPPLIIREGGRVECLRSISGPALGVVEGVDYEPLVMRLAPGETLVLYTDGVTEAMNGRNELYEDERLVQLLELQDPFVPAQMLVERIMVDVQAHAGDTAQSDDITLVALRFHQQPKRSS